jgi:hypothetical protein
VSAVVDAKRPRAAARVTLNRLLDDGTGRVGPRSAVRHPRFPTSVAIAVAVVALEFAAIAWVRNRSMDTPFLSAASQVVAGGLLVFGTGILTGNSRLRLWNVLCLHCHDAR